MKMPMSEQTIGSNPKTKAMVILSMFFAVFIPAVTAITPQARRVLIPSTTKPYTTAIHGRMLVPPHGGPSSGSSSSSTTEWKGCLEYSDYQLSYSWKLKGDRKDCSWVHYYYDDDYYSDDAYGNNGGVNSGGSGSGSSSGNGSNGGDGVDDDNNDESGEGASGNDDSGGGDDDDDDDDGNSSNSGGNDSQVVVSNEDVSGGDSEFDPLEDFDILKCETYENLWLWDLDLTCGIQDATGASSSYDDCNCVFAEKLMAEGLLSCEESGKCPDECPVCALCLALLCEGVVPNGVTGPSDVISKPALMYVLAAVVGFLLISLAIYYARRRRNHNNELNKSLMNAHDKGGTMYISDGTYDDGIISDSDETSTFKPPSPPALVSDQHTLQETIPPVGTMSTSCTTHMPPGGSVAGNSLLPPPSDASSDVGDDNGLLEELPTSFSATGVQLDLETGMVSPMPTMEGSSDRDSASRSGNSSSGAVGVDDNEHFQRGMSYFEKYTVDDDDEDVPAVRGEMN